MSGRMISDLSPWRVGLMHGITSLALFSGIFGMAGLGIHVTGNAEDAGPRAELALFEPRTATARPLKTGFDTPTLAALQPRLSSVPQLNTQLPDEEPSLFDDEEPVSVTYDAPVARRPVAPDSVRINGKIVPAGRSLSDVTEEIRLSASPISGLYERARGTLLPIIAEDGRRPDKAYARPVQNPEGRPTVSIVVGGLGINRSTTLAAIRDLPPEVTLSFVAHAANLPAFIRRARNAGHEVMIELPMEGFDAAGGRPPANLLRTGQTEQNAGRLLNLLGTTTGYFAVTNYKGNKLALDTATVDPLIETLANRGVAFIEDGSLNDARFAESARTYGTAFAQSDLIIDAEMNANDIEAQLFSLETQARQSGAAMGTGFAFPMTVDTIKTWAQSLDEKGLTLVPASSRLTRSTPQKSASLAVTGSGGTQ